MPSRSLSTMEFAIFCTVIVLGLGWLFRNGGEKIQEVVNEKSNVVDVRAATVLDFVYAVILYIFKFVSKIPMSTTWVFVGLLAGREIAMTWQGAGEEGRSVKDALKLAGRDLLYVTIGFVISVILAAMINPSGRSPFWLSVLKSDIDSLRKRQFVVTFLSMTCLVSTSTMLRTAHDSDTEVIDDSQNSDC